MTRQTPDMLITAALRELDPGSRSDLTEGEQIRAAAAFDRIVATPGHDQITETPGRPNRGRRRLLLAAGLAVAAVAAIPAMVPGGGTAYGSWSATPEPLLGGAAARAATTCRAAFGVPARGERVAVAERRGGWTYVLLAGPGTETICLMPDDFIAKYPTDRGDFFGSNDPDAPAPPTLAADGFDENTSMEGSTDEGWFVWTEGYVGSDVTGVTVHRSSGPDVEASVVGNRFAAWWPGIVQSSRNPEGNTWSYTVHLADGSKRHID